MYPFNFSNIVYVLFANITCISYHNYICKLQIQSLDKLFLVLAVKKILVLAVKIPILVIYSSIMFLNCVISYLWPALLSLRWNARASLSWLIFSSYCLSFAETLVLQNGGDVGGVSNASMFTSFILLPLIVDLKRVFTTLTFSESFSELSCC